MQETAIMSTPEKLFLDTETLRVFKKQLREELVLQYVINFVIVRAFFLSTSLITLFTKE